MTWKKRQIIRPVPIFHWQTLITRVIFSITYFNRSQYCFFWVIVFLSLQVFELLRSIENETSGKTNRCAFFCHPSTPNACYLRVFNLSLTKQCSTSVLTIVSVAYNCNAISEQKISKGILNIRVIYSFHLDYNLRAGNVL